MRVFGILAVASVGLIGLTGCQNDTMSNLEALDALAEVNQSSRGEAATGDIIEVSTDFTMGDALAAAAQRIGDFWESQAPCTEVTLEGAKVTVDYGTLEDACTFEGRTYAGVNTTEVISTEAGQLEVEHVWTGFTNGDVTVDGDADVTWTGTDATRRVQTTHTWTDSSGIVVDVVGDHVQGPLEDDGGWGAWLSGITMEGKREWTHDDELWTLDMSELELRWIDPAPQAGSLTVINPDGKELTVTYSRIDDATIEAVLVGLRRDVVVHINRLGQIEEVEE